MDNKVIWLDEYSVNNELIDEQHKYLFSLCNTLYKLIDEPKAVQSTEQALMGLQDYIEIHFNSEEKQYQEHPLLAEHQQQHLDFIKQIDGYIEDYNQSCLKLVELADFTRDWLVNHITITDRQYFKDIDGAR